jgi:hypothetical protein
VVMLCAVAMRVVIREVCCEGRALECRAL